MLEIIFFYLLHYLFWVSLLIPNAHVWRNNNKKKTWILCEIGGIVGYFYTHLIGNKISINLRYDYWDCNGVCTFEIMLNCQTK